MKTEVHKRKRKSTKVNCKQTGLLGNYDKKKMVGANEKF